MSSGPLREYHLSVDDFNQPKKSEDATALGVLIVRLILMEPGTNPNRPEMGLGIVSRFRYMQESDLPSLSTELKNQLSTYLAPYKNVDVSISMNSNLELVFDIKVEKQSYKYVTSKQENNKITLSEL